MMHCPRLRRLLSQILLSGRNAGSVSKPVTESDVKPFGEIPGPKALPLIGNLWRYLPFVGQYSFEKLHRTYARFQQDFGFLVREEVLGDRVLVHVFHPADMRTVYGNEGRKPHRTSHRAVEKYRKERPEVYKSAGLFPSNGDEWYRFRHLFQKILLFPGTSAACASVLENVTDDFVSRVASLLDERGELDLQPELFNWALECIGAITLNRRLGCLSPEGNVEASGLIQAANVIHRTVFKTENNPLCLYMHSKSYAALEEAQDFLASCVQRYMTEAMLEISQDRATGSVLAKMLEVETADHRDVFTMILDMFLAGIDTTAYTTAFALYNLSRNRAVQDRLRQELLDHLPTKDCRVDRLPRKIPYLQWVIKESLRVNPVSIGTGRVIPCDLVLSGYRVPAGTMVILQHQVASKHPSFFREPEVFLPERWSSGNCGGIASSPFGFGPRLCVGMRFAKMEMYLALAKLVRRYELSYHYEDIDSVNRLINVPDKPMRLRLKAVER